MEADIQGNGSFTLNKLTSINIQNNKDEISKISIDITLNKKKPFNVD